MTFELYIQALKIGLLIILALAAYWDVRERRIPNWSAAAAALLSLAIVLQSQGPMEALWGFATGMAMLVAGYILYAIKWIGAGDAKLFAAVAILAGWDDLGLLAFYTVLSGGIIAAVMLAMKPKQALALITFRPIAEATEVPYGLAIAFGGVALVVLGQTV
jgi:prepilin peptidase CpaA